MAFYTQRRTFKQSLSDTFRMSGKWVHSNFKSNEMESFNDIKCGEFFFYMILRGFLIFKAAARASNEFLFIFNYFLNLK